MLYNADRQTNAAQQGYKVHTDAKKRKETHFDVRQLVYMDILSTADDICCISNGRENKIQISPVHPWTLLCHVDDILHYYYTQGQNSVDCFYRPYLTAPIHMQLQSYMMHDECS